MLSLEHPKQSFVLLLALAIAPSCGSENDVNTSDVPSSVADAGVDDSNPQADSSSSDSGSHAGSAGSPGTSSGGSGGNPGSAGSGGSAGGGSPSSVCERWNADRANAPEAVWSGGDLQTCKAGDIAPPGRQTTLRLINLYRWLAGLPAVSDDATRNAKAQQCALMISINGLNHAPPSSWKCYSADGAEAAENSNESGGPAVSGIDAYMQDSGNASTFGHRRWILANNLGPVGIGSAKGSCLWVIGGSGQGKNEWTAFPSPGEVPLDLMKLASSTAWTIQSNSITLKGASVQVSEGSTNLSVVVSQLAPHYGSTNAISVQLKGWSPQAGHSYHVEVSGASKPISYDLKVVDCK